MDDVAIAGGGPAGALAAIILAKAGVRVRVFDRARFPRPKLCGDTLNPGALRVLARHLDLRALTASSDPIDGMLLTGPGVTVRGRYGAGLSGRAIRRADLDGWLLGLAANAGATVDEGALVSGAMGDGGRVTGLVVTGRSRACEHPARMVIAADGRRSRVAIGRGLARQPARPRRWAIGSYFTGVEGMSTLGEMHVRRGHYIGVAPVPGGLVNACLVVPHASGQGSWSDGGRMLAGHLRADPQLGPRFARATAVEPPTVLGPMAVDAVSAGAPGLLLAGDAAGFIDPITGDGLHFALAGAALAAAAALDVLSGRLAPDRAHVDLASRRARAFRAKWRFNRALRGLVASPRGVTGAALTARVMPSLFEAVIRIAGDCDADDEVGSREPGTGNPRLPDPRLPDRLPDPGSRFPS